VAFVSVEFRLSERTACKLLGVERSSYRYEPRPDRNIALREELVKLARQKPRYGYRRLHALLERRGLGVNVKRVYRLYAEEGLAVRRRKRKRLVRDRALEPRLIRPNEEWAMDSIIDGLATGRMVRILSVVDAYTRECLANQRLLRRPIISRLPNCLATVNQSGKVLSCLSPSCRFF
jgi:putative transposase